MHPWVGRPGLGFTFYVVAVNEGARTSRSCVYLYICEHMDPHACIFASQWWWESYKYTCVHEQQRKYTDVIQGIRHTNPKGNHYSTNKLSCLLEFEETTAAFHWRAQEKTRSQLLWVIHNSQCDHISTHLFLIIVSHLQKPLYWPTHAWITAIAVSQCFFTLNFIKTGWRMRIGNVSLICTRAYECGKY